VRVVMLSKALVTATYRRKLEELASLPGIELTAIVPPTWRDRGGEARLEPGHTAGYTLLVAPLAFNGQYHLHFYPTLGRLLRQLRPDVLHVDEEPYNLATWHALRLGQAVGARGLFFTWQNLERRYPWPFSHFERSNYRRAAYAIAGNQGAVSVLRAKGYRGPVAVIPQFGVDPHIFAPQKMRGSTDGDVMIGYAGRLVPEKGVELLLRACAGLPRTGWRLAILGDGPDRARLARVASELNIADQVRFWGHLPSAQMPRFYAEMDILVLPSITRPNWTEQFGRVLIEAMACGVPVIGSDAGEIPHVIGDAGIVVPQQDVMALRDAIAELAGDPARRAELAARGRQRVLDHYTQARIAAATYQVYQAIKGFRPPPLGGGS